MLMGPFLTDCWRRKFLNSSAKWLNIHSSTTDISLYSLISPCPLPIKSLISIPKSSKISGHQLLWDSKDPLVSFVSPSLKHGHWKATPATQITKAKLNFCKIRGPLHLGRSGLGNVKPTPVPEERSQAHRKLVSKTHREIEEEHNVERALHTTPTTMSLGAMGRLHPKLWSFFCSFSWKRVSVLIWIIL